VLAGDQARVSYLLDKKHASLGALDLQGETPLHHALQLRSPIWSPSSRRGADVSQRDRDGWTPLMTAA
jgi:ankyrin repeat protein